jgi:hypothetical protein
MSKHSPQANAPLEFHPLADIFPLMVEGAEFDELVADIKARGLREAITMFEGKILDGRNRYLAARIAMKPEDKAHLDAGVLYFTQFDGDDALAFVISKNLHRRHLTAEQRRDLLVKLVAATPEKSDRAIATEAKVDHHQVARARKKAEATGTKVPVDGKRTGADGKTRKPPAKTNAAKTNGAAAGKPPAAEVANNAEAERKMLNGHSDASIIDQLREKNRALEFKLAGTESEVEDLKKAAASGAPITKLTIKQITTALIELVQDEPAETTKAIVTGLGKAVTKAWQQRRRDGIPTRTEAPKKKTEAAAQAQVSSALASAFSEMIPGLAPQGVAKKAKNGSAS